MSEDLTEKPILNQIPSHILDLMLDVILDVMRAERGSVMLLDEKTQELTIRSARGLKNEIIEKARVRLGSGVSGKVAATGRSVFLKGISGERRVNIKADDLINPGIDTSYVVPLKLHDGTLGTVNVHSLKKGHDITAEREGLVQGILYRFMEYLRQVEPPPEHHGNPSQLYMMNVFREHNTLRELRVVFDFIFHLVTDLLDTRKKGVFLLKNQDSGFFDLVLGYGFDPKHYLTMYDELIPCLKSSKLHSFRDIKILHRKDIFEEEASFFQEDFYLLAPLIWQNNIHGLVFICTDSEPVLDKQLEGILQTVCGAAAKTISDSAAGQKFDELTSTDSLTGTYNYGLWWKRLYEEFGRMQRRQGSRMSLLMLDIDRFERFNRAHGYLLGDKMLRFLADRIKGSLRINDIVGRVGGDEFGVVLPDTSKQDARKVGERIMEAVSGLERELRVRLSHPITLSGGLAECPGDAETPELLVENAKTALVSANIQGGNHIQSFGHIEE